MLNRQGLHAEAMTNESRSDAFGEEGRFVGFWIKEGSETAFTISAPSFQFHNHQYGIVILLQSLGYGFQLTIQFVIRQSFT